MDIKMRRFVLPLKLLVLVIASVVVVACSGQSSTVEETEVGFKVVKDTKLILVLQTDLSSNSAKEGDTFKSQLKEPLKLGERVILPENAVVYASVKSVKKYEKFGDKASLGFSFEQIELPDGKIVKLAASLDQTKGKSPIKVPGKAKEDANTVLGTAVMGALMEDAAQVSTTQTMSDSGLLLGAMIGTGAVLLSKAKEVHLPIGTEMTITLGEELFISKH